MDAQRASSVMRASEARQHVREMAADFDVVAKGLMRARANYQAWTGLGYPTQSMGGSSSGHGVPNPTETVALSVIDRTEREALAKEWAELDADVETARLALQRARKKVTATTITTGKPGALGCTNCDDARRRNGQPHPEAFQPRHANGLCQFCDDFAQRYGIEPGPDVVLYHLDHLGQRVPYSIIRAAHPREFEQVHAGKSRRRG